MKFRLASPSYLTFDSIYSLKRSARLLQSPSLAVKCRTQSKTRAERFDNHPIHVKLNVSPVKCFSYRWERRPCCLALVSEPLQPVETELPWCRLKVPLSTPFTLWPRCARALVWIWTVWVWMYAGWPCRIHRRCLAASQYLLSDSPGTFYIFASFGCSVLTVDKRRENPDPTWRR